MGGRALALGGLTGGRLTSTMAQVGTITRTGGTQPYKANLEDGTFLGQFGQVSEAEQAFRSVRAGRVKFVREDLPGDVEFYRVLDF